MHHSGTHICHKTQTNLIAGSPTSGESQSKNWFQPAEKMGHINEMKIGILQLHKRMQFQPFEQTAKTAHWLISSAIILGYPSLVAALRAIERAALEGCTENFGGVLIDALNAVFGDLVGSPEKVSGALLV